MSKEVKEVRSEVVDQLVESGATAEELQAARKAQREAAEAKAAEEAAERLSELEAQEAQLNAEIEKAQGELKEVRANIRKCNSALGNNTRSEGFGKGIKASEIVAKALKAHDGPARPRDIIAWINKNKCYNGATNALSSTVSQTLNKMVKDKTVSKDLSAKTYSLA